MQGAEGYALTIAFTKQHPEAGLISMVVWSNIPHYEWSHISTRVAGLRGVVIHNRSPYPEFMRLSVSES
jgi:hypothetical protein